MVRTGVAFLTASLRLLGVGGCCPYLLIFHLPALIQSTSKQLHKGCRGKQRLLSSGQRKFQCRRAEVAEVSAESRQAAELEAGNIGGLMELLEADYRERAYFVTGAFCMWKPVVYGECYCTCFRPSRCLASFLFGRFPADMQTNHQTAFFINSIELRPKLP